MFSSVYHFFVKHWNTLESLLNLYLDICDVHNEQ